MLFDERIHQWWLKIHQSKPFEKSLKNLELAKNGLICGDLTKQMYLLLCIFLMDF